MENTQLLCTFTKKKYVSETLSLIENSYETVSKIFILENTDDVNDLYCTYNVENRELQEKSFLRNTISVHRNKSTNTLYTINAVNSIVFLLNDGNRDETFKIDWQKYRNCIMVTNELGLKRINTKIHKIVTL